MNKNRVKWGKTFEGTKRRWKACVMHGGPFQASNLLSIFGGSTQVEDGTRVLGLIVRGLNGLAVATQVQQGQVRVWPRAGG